MTLPRLPDAELMIMNIIWRAKGEITSAEIAEKLEGQKEWGLTTILTLLSRLGDRKFVAMRKRGRVNIYKPLVEEAEYVKKESKSFLSRLHGNSVTSLIASLYDGDAITENDLNELKAFIDGR